MQFASCWFSQTSNIHDSAEVRFVRQKGAANYWKQDTTYYVLLVGIWGWSMKKKKLKHARGMLHMSAKKFRYCSSAVNRHNENYIQQLTKHLINTAEVLTLCLLQSIWICEISYIYKLQTADLYHCIYNWQVEEGGEATLTTQMISVLDVDSSINQVMFVVETSPHFGILQNRKPGNMVWCCVFA